jgi:hypothetical protein
LRKINLVILIVVFVFLAVPIPASASDIKFSLNAAKDTEANLLSGDNIHAVYTLVIAGAKGVTGEPNSFFKRSVEVALIGALAREFRLLGHEANHAFVARENGAWSTEIRRRGFTYSGNLSDSEKLRVTASGFDWVNTSAEDVYTRNLGKKISVTELSWFVLNQLNPSTYIFFDTKSPDECLSECRVANADSEQWYGIMGNSDLETMNKLYKDLRIGAAWQTLGLVLPSYHVAKYWVAGKEYTLPGWWVNPQFDMTDAGVMYALGMWYKTDGGLIVRLRPGYGKNRVAGGHMTAFEVGLYDIRITKKLKVGIRGGISEALKSSNFVGASIERSAGDKFSVGIDANYYDGYNRNNPVADGNWKDAALFVRARF